MYDIFFNAIKLYEILFVLKKDYMNYIILYLILFIHTLSQYFSV